MSFQKLALFVLAGLASALPHDAKPAKIDRRSTAELNGVNYDVFEHAATNATMSYVKNSGICETTEGVNQYSGYLTVGTGMNMWFWFFEARNSASTAPLAMWLNGGPGCSSMIGLFQENGPCHFANGSSEPSLNEYSWNTYANMLYVDQPIGTGFSYGTDGATSTVNAAVYVWKLLQAFYTAFPDYQSREFGLWTESYGGHYGPEFADYFEQQNAGIDKGIVQGEKINLVALGINNGWIDPLLQYQAYPQFAYSNTYKQLITGQEYNSYMKAYTGTCVPSLNKCTGLTGNNAACLNGDAACASSVETPIENANNFNVYDIRKARNAIDPPETYVNYLTSAAVVKAIGAQATYGECPTTPYVKMVSSGDEPRSFLQPLSDVVKSGVNVLVWAGDADWICNWLGSQLVVNEVTYNQSALFKSTVLKNYTVDGTARGQFKSVGNLNFMRVYEAGHEVPYYQPEAALQAFTQIMQGKALTST